MTTDDVLNDLQARIRAGYPLLFLNTHEELRWEAELVGLADEIDRGLVLWSATRGAEPPAREADADLSTDPLLFLEQVSNYPPDHLFLLKDFQSYLDDADVVRRLRDLAGSLPEENKTLLLIGSEPEIPVSLAKDAAVIDLPLPGIEELRTVLDGVLRRRKQRNEEPIEISSAMEDQIVTTVLGLTAREAENALTLVIQGRDAIDDSMFVELVGEKKNRVSGSDLLEFIDLDDSVANIGGLEGLKEWLSHRAQAFAPQAREQGVPMPKGVLLFGVQGCGKSLTARATAHMLRFPLIRLDLANLLSSDRGASERNMRDVLRLVETLAPAVLWIDELDKGFAGLVAESDFDSTVSRIFGRFLVWMEEKTAPVFVTATANSVQNLPPELLRRGRFDEMFFIDLPNYYERTQIFKVHLQRRGWKPDKFDVASLVDQTEGYSGAEIQQIVSAAILETYGRGSVLTQEAPQQACEQIVPLSITMEDRIFSLREWARERCRPATLDSRVMRMLEDEDRAISRDVKQEATVKWHDLADLGQTGAAVCEFVRAASEVTFVELQTTFEEFGETSGDQGLALRADPNIVLWSGMSAEFATVLGKLIREKKLYVKPIRANRYDDDALKLPILEKFSKGRLERPYWLPATLVDHQPDNSNSKLERVTRMKLTR